MPLDESWLRPGEANDRGRPTKTDTQSLDLRQWWEQRSQFKTWDTPPRVLGSHLVQHIAKTMGVAAGSEHGLDNVVKRAESRAGKFTISGRYHRMPRKLEDDYVILKKNILGSGYNGKVFEARGRTGGGTYAVKGFKLVGVPREKRDTLLGCCLHQMDLFTRGGDGGNSSSGQDQLSYVVAVNRFVAQSLLLLRFWQMEDSGTFSRFVAESVFCRAFSRWWRGAIQTVVVTVPEDQMRNVQVYGTGSAFAAILTGGSVVTAPCHYTTIRQNGSS
eukprot:s1726_g9.t1